MIDSGSRLFWFCLLCFSLREHAEVQHAGLGIARGDHVRAEIGVVVVLFLFLVEEPVVLAGVITPNT